MNSNLEFPVIDASDGGEKVLTRAQKKNMRKKQKKKEGKQNEYAFEIEEVITSMDQVKVDESESDDVLEGTELSHKYSDVQEIEHTIDLDKKRIRTLRKKLKQITELEDKIDSGDIRPDREQLQKLSKKEEFLEEFQKLSLKIT